MLLYAERLAGIPGWPGVGRGQCPAACGGRLHCVYWLDRHAATAADRLFLRSLRHVCVTRDVCHLSVISICDAARSPAGALELKEAASAGGSSDNPANQVARGGALKCAKEKNRCGLCTRCSACSGRQHILSLIVYIGVYWFESGQARKVMSCRVRRQAPKFDTACVSCAGRRSGASASAKSA